MNENQMRLAFETWYVSSAQALNLYFITMDNVASLREGNGYGEERVALNSKWESWQIDRAAYQSDAEWADTWTHSNGMKTFSFQMTKTIRVNIMAKTELEARDFVVDQEKYGINGYVWSEAAITSLVTVPFDPTVQEGR